jgi:hypothetical protein
MAYVIEKTQQLEFVSRVLPSLFHSAPEEFMFFLARDGNKFLRFYWDEAGKKVDEAQRVTSFGLNYEIRQPSQHVRIGLISLPEPRLNGEAYFASVIYRPTRVTPFRMVQDTTKVLTLEEALNPCKQLTTRLVEWTRRIERVELGQGQSPALEDFYQGVLDLLRG